MILVRLQYILGSYDRNRAMTVKNKKNNKNSSSFCNRKYNLH